MENMDSTVITTSLPAIAADIGENPLALKLALTSYLVEPRGLHPDQRLGGRPLRLAHRVRMRASSCSSAARCLCAVSSSLPAFVAARFLQGIGGAMMVPVGRLVLMRAVPKQELRRRAQLPDHSGADGAGDRAGARRRDHAVLPLALDLHHQSCRSASSASFSFCATSRTRRRSRIAAVRLARLRAVRHRAVGADAGTLRAGRPSAARAQ